jgi:hypothetical protein
VSREKLLQATEDGGLTPAYNGGREECSLIYQSTVDVYKVCLVDDTCDALGLGFRFKGLVFYLGFLGLRV